MRERDFSVTLLRLRSGTLLREAYRITSLLTVSGVSELWDATSDSGQRVVVKVAAAGRSFDVPGLELATAENTGFARVLVYGEMLDGCMYCVKQSCNGMTLRRLMCHGALVPFAVLQIVDQLRSALGYAHARGLVHGRLQPEHVMIDEDDDGEPRVTLLGLGSGVGAGDPAYLAPEQLAGGPVDARTDVFALSALAVEMLTGVGAFATTSFVRSEVLAQRLAGMKPRLSPRLDLALQRARARARRDPAERWASVDDLALALASPHLARGNARFICATPTTKN